MIKILFITANRVGDAVLTTGLLAWMVDHYPDAQFTIACGPFGADLFRATPRLSRLIVMKKKKYNGHWLDLWMQCIGTEWDLIVDMRNSIVSRLLRAKRRAIHSRSSGAHKVVDNAAVMGLNPPPNPHIWIAPEAMQAAARLLPAGKPILALGPAANWPLKQWPIGHFISLVQILTAPDGVLPDARVMVVAAEHERAQIDSLLKAIPQARCIDIIGSDLQMAAACLKHTRLYIGNDSGLMHLSAALGTPTLGLFGPGMPLVYGPWGPHCAYVTTPESREALLAATPAIVTPTSSLMGSLSVEHVAAAAGDLLASTASLFRA